MKFMLITVGFKQPDAEMMDKWNRWFESIGDKMVEQVGLMNGVEVTNGSERELAFDENALTGYLVVEVADKNEALEIARTCPMVTSTLAYEVRT